MTQIGVNYRGQPVELGGCVDDTLNIKRFLSSTQPAVVVSIHLGAMFMTHTATCNYKDGDIVVLTDNHGNPHRPQYCKFLRVM